MEDEEWEELEVEAGEKKKYRIARKVRARRRTREGMLRVWGGWSSDFSNIWLWGVGWMIED